MPQPAPESRPNQTEDGLCDENVVDLARVRHVRQRLESPKVLIWAADTLKTLADPTRLKIVRALMIEERLCVCDLAALVGVSASAVSHQLRLLRSARLVRPEREGKRVYYWLDDEHVSRIVELMIHHVQHD